MQEELEQKSVVLATNTAKLTGRTLAKLMQSALRKMKQARDTPKEGKQSMKELAKGGSLANVKVTDGNIRSFDPVARKYNISYSLKRDDSSEPPRHLIFFRGKDMDAMTAAFKEFSAKAIRRGKEKPSVKENMQELGETVQHAVRDKTRNKHRERSDR